MVSYKYIDLSLHMLNKVQQGTQYAYTPVLFMDYLHESSERVFEQRGLGFGKVEVIGLYWKLSESGVDICGLDH